MEENFIKDMPLTADELSRLQDKNFTIVGHRYQTIEFDNPKTKEKETKEKLVLSISLSNKAIVDYYPNKTTEKTLKDKFGRNLNEWVGQQAEFEVLDQMVAGEKKKVIYVRND